MSLGTIRYRNHLEPNRDGLGGHLRSKSITCVSTILIAVAIHCYCETFVRTSIETYDLSQLLHGDIDRTNDRTPRQTSAHTDGLLAGCNRHYALCL